jgi:SAM-dependent methyltransferase
MMTVCAQKVYQNAGNLPLLRMIPPNSRVLDCGCGAGDNARILKSYGCRVTGITISASEREAALAHCDEVHLADLEDGIPEQVAGSFDVVLFSHVLEHLVHPGNVLRDARRLLMPKGLIAVALPNVLEYHNRFDFLMGRFEYTSGGIMDETHVRFYTFACGKRLLIENGYTIVVAQADGAFPLWKMRQVLPAQWMDWINRWACQHWPGLFGAQSLYLARPKT